MALLVGTAAWVVANDDGTGQSGSVWDVAWVAAAAASIDAVIQSATNPSITPAAIIDEVVTARGSKSSLDARLDIALNEDGTLKAVAGQATNTDLQAILQARNIFLNGNLEDWTLGGALAPDNFVLSGAAVTIARTGPAMGDTFTFGTGTFAAKLTRAGTDGKLTQTLISAGEMPAAADVKGKSIGVLVMGKTAIANHLRITVDDGILTTSSSFHAGDGVGRALTVLHTLSASATKLEVYAQIMNSNGDAYVGGFTGVFSNLVPTRWLPLDGVPVASAARGGTLAVGAQTIPGPKTAAGVWTFGAMPVGFGMPVFVRTTADFTKNNSAALADVTGMVFPIGVGETWIFEYVLKCVSSAVADYKFAVTFPAAPTALWYGVGAFNGEILLGIGATVTGGTAVLAGSGGAVEEMISVRGMVINGANAGNVQLQFAQNTAEVSNSIVHLNSYVIATRVA